MLSLFCSSRLSGAMFCAFGRRAGGGKIARLGNDRRLPLGLLVSGDDCSPVLLPCSNQYLSGCPGMYSPPRSVQIDFAFKATTFSFDAPALTSRLKSYRSRSLCSCCTEKVVPSNLQSRIILVENRTYPLRCFFLVGKADYALILT